MKLNIGLCQLKITKNKEENFKNVMNEISKLCKLNVNMVVLPECWNCPYGIEYFEEYSEDVNDSQSVKLLESLAKKKHIYIIGGSIPIRDKGNLYNTCFCFDPEGNIIGRYDKIHLFDIEIREFDFSFKESSVLSSGKNPLIIDTIYGKIGIAICFDLRFPLLAEKKTKNNCKMIIYPGSFSEKTGPLHWTLLLRTRALDNQCFVIGCSTSKNENFKYKGYGHSSIINPMGKIVYEAGEDQIATNHVINLNEILEVKRNIPMLNMWSADS